MSSGMEAAPIAGALGAELHGVDLAGGLSDAAVADIQANFFQLFCYPWPAIAAQTETRLFLDMRKRNQIRSLPPASWTTAERAQTTRADVHHMAHPTNGECR